jgi:hypothetical protein
MVATVPFVPKGYLYSEDALLRIANIRHPDRWRQALLHPKEAEIYANLNQPKGFNAQVLQYILMDEIPLDDLNANPDIARRLRDFDYAAYDLRIALYSGDIIAEFIDKRGKLGWIKSSSWGGDNAMSILLLGVVDLEDGAYGRRILFKIDSIDKLAKQPVVRPKRHPKSRAEMERGFGKWRKDCEPHIPSETEDYEYMSREFGASREIVRDLRESVPKLPRGRPPAKSGRDKSREK